MGHSGADMDCMGASMGIYRLTTKLNKEAHIVLNPKGENLKAFKRIRSKQRLCKHNCKPRRGNSSNGRRYITCSC